MSLLVEWATIQVIFDGLFWKHFQKNFIFYNIYNEIRCCINWLMSDFKKF